MGANPDCRQEGIVNSVASYAAWRCGMDVVGFDPDMPQLIYRSKPPDILVSDIMKYLPAWSILVCQPVGITLDNGKTFDGFFATMDMERGEKPQKYKNGLHGQGGVLQCSPPIRQPPYLHA